MSEAELISKIGKTFLNSYYFKRAKTSLSNTFFHFYQIEHDRKCNQTKRQGLIIAHNLQKKVPFSINHFVTHLIRPLPPKKMTKQLTLFVFTEDAARKLEKLVCVRIQTFCNSSET